MSHLFVVDCDLNEHALAQFRPAFDRLSILAEDVVVDLRHVKEMDGAGVGALVYLLKRLRAGGRQLAVVNVSGQPADLLRELKLGAAFSWRVAAPTSGEPVAQRVPAE